jgi:hypothetical protein
LYPKTENLCAKWSIRGDKEGGGGRIQLKPDSLRVGYMGKNERSGKPAQHEYTPGKKLEQLLEFFSIFFILFVTALHTQVIFLC